VAGTSTEGASPVGDCRQGGGVPRSCRRE
jgi:hypothetical protein